MIWIIGGTSNANEICKLLLNKQFKVLISVTTLYGSELAQQLGASVVQDALDAQKMQQLILNNRIELVVDASHPFAADVSRTAMQVASESQTPYLRFERAKNHFNNAHYFETYQQVTNYLDATSGNILITTGSKYCSLYTALDIRRLYIRVLQVSSSILQCQQAGFLPHHIITTTHVETLETNVALLQKHAIRYLITKDSGTDGGLNEKVMACESVGAQALIISRPPIQYPQYVSTYDELMQCITTII